MRVEIPNELKPLPENNGTPRHAQEQKTVKVVHPENVDDFMIIDLADFKANQVTKKYVLWEKVKIAKNTTDETTEDRTEDNTSGNEATTVEIPET